ncbi:MAG TPA: DUF5709 domain-containing protein [Actinomycetales bacterium]|nr:DUF5709 domain-containing protein [Actinomycetales bacterium]
MTNTDDDSIGDGLGGSYSIDDDDQLQPEETLVDRGLDDVLEEGYSPPDRPVAVDKFGTTASEAEEGETLDMRLAEEVPDPNLQVEDPLARRPDPLDERVDTETQLDRDLGYADPDDGGEVGDERAGRLVAPDEGAHEDTEKDMVAEDVGIAGAGAGAEEAAVHVVDEDEIP